MNLAGEYASMHHDATMLELGVRTTIDLPDDLHKQALAIARDTHRTLSETVADLMRRGLGAGRTAALSEDPRTGLPLVSVGTVVTSEDVRSLIDSWCARGNPRQPRVMSSARSRRRTATSSGPTLSLSSK